VGGDAPRSKRPGGPTVASEASEGGGGGTRTLMFVRTVDFESTASAIPPRPQQVWPDPGEAGSGSSLARPAEARPQACWGAQHHGGQGWALRPRRGAGWPYGGQGWALRPRRGVGWPYGGQGWALRPRRGAGWPYGGQGWALRPRRGAGWRRGAPGRGRAGGGAAGCGVGMARWGWGWSTMAGVLSTRDWHRLRPVCEGAGGQRRRRGPFLDVRTARARHSGVYSSQQPAPAPKHAVAGTPEES
jgi:hypothetical protein